MYKKLIKSRRIRLMLLDLFSFIPDEVMLRAQYFVYFSRKLNVNNPLRFTEKIQVYKMKYWNNLLPICVDKLKVRNYIKECGLEDILVNLYGVYESLDDINFKELPDNYVIKTTAGGGGINVYIVENNQINLDELKSKMSINYKYRKNPGREKPYEQVENKFIVEELLIDNSEESGIRDYKFMCFNGKVHYIIVDFNRYVNHERNIYDLEWNKLDIETDKKQYRNQVTKPKNLKKMIDISERLASNFPFVRVDLYNIDGQIYFGELTFYPWSGYVKFTPDEFDYILGDLLDLEGEDFR